MCAVLAEGSFLMPAGTELPISLITVPISTLLTPTTTFLKGNLVREMGEVGVSRVYIPYIK